MLAVAVSAHAPTADPRIEVTLSPRLRTSPLPVTPAGVADRWRNIGSCQKPPWRNALQVEKMLRIAHKRIEHIELRSHFPDASVDHTDARKATVRRFGRSDRRAQRHPWLLRSIRPKRATFRPLGRSTDGTNT